MRGLSGGGIKLPERVLDVVQPVLAQRKLRLGLDSGQRGTQLMRRICGKALLR